MGIIKDDTYLTEVYYLLEGGQGGIPFMVLRPKSLSFMVLLNYFLLFMVFDNGIKFYCLLFQLLIQIMKCVK